MVRQNVQLEPEVPAGLVLAPVGVFVSQQAHAAVADRLADRDVCHARVTKLAVHQVEVVREGQGRLWDESAHESGDVMQAGQPLRVAR